MVRLDPAELALPKTCKGGPDDRLSRRRRGSSEESVYLLRRRLDVAGFFPGEEGNASRKVAVCPSPLTVSETGDPTKDRKAAINRRRPESVPNSCLANSLCSFSNPLEVKTL